MEKMKNGKDKAGPAIEDVPVAASFHFLFGPALELVLPKMMAVRN